jgi:hypothetical protein
MEFLQDLNEARMVVSKSHLRRLTARDVADLVFLHLLTLQLFKQEYSTRSWAINYAHNTWQGGNFANLRADRTDLYNLLFLIVGQNNDDAIKRLKNPEESKELIKYLSVDRDAIRRYLRLVATNKSNPGWERRFFLQIQVGLHIDTQGYRAIRQIVTHYDPMNYEHKRLVVTRLLMAFRKRAIRSDMYKRLEQFAKTQKLEIKDRICNPETGKGCEQEQIVAHQPKKRGSALAKAAAVAGVAAGAWMLGTSGRSKE